MVFTKPGGEERIFTTYIRFGRQPVIFADRNVRPLGTDRPSRAVAYDIESLDDHERTAVEQAIESGKAELPGPPSFGLYAIGASGERYYELSAKRLGYTSHETTITAERVDYTTADATVVVDFDEFDGRVRDVMASAIAKARYLHTRQQLDVEPLSDKHEQTAFHQQHEVLDPSEAIQSTLADKPDRFIVEDQDEHYRIQIVEKEAPMETFAIDASEVARDSQTFDEWFLEEYVYLDSEYQTLSAEEQQVMSQAETGVYNDQSPFSSGLSQLLNRLDINEHGNDSEHHYVRLDNELQYVSVSKAIGC